MLPASVSPSASPVDAAVPQPDCRSQLEVIPPDSDSAGAHGPVTYRSRGAVLVLGDGVDVLAPARALAARMKVVAFAPGIQDAGNLPRNLVAVGGRIVSVTGHLGCFHARAATGAGAHRDMGPFSPNADGGYDLVLDLSKVPLIRCEVKPHGYFAPRDDAGLEAALSALPELVGAFRQPRHLALASAPCVHGRQGLTGCTRCIDVCGVGAIRSSVNVVSIDPSLCQGCAACTLACPTGAVSFAAPTRPDLLGRLKKTLRASIAEGVTRPVLVVHVPADAAVAQKLPPDARPFEVAALPAFGDELWLAALAAGFRAVLLLDHEALTSGTRRALEGALAQTRALVNVAGRADAVIALVTADQLARNLTDPQTTRRAPVQAPESAIDDLGKRQTAVKALATLSCGPGARPAPLPAGAAFGAVRVHRDACTLCLACVNLCPVGALSGNSEPVRRLAFHESACVQCGLCVSGCPEHALALQPRASAFSRPARTALVLAEDDMVRCTECRKPFIGRRMLMRSLSSMKTSAAFQGESQKPLYQCAGCRSRSLFG